MPLVLDLRHYETVVAIIELGTMTAAAKRLSTTQSALSHRVAEAEHRLGVKLFERGHHRRLKPTRAGLVLHQTATRALNDLERTETLLLAEDERVTANVRIAVGSYDCFHWFPQFVSLTRRTHPEIELELVVVGDAPGAALAGDRADLVIAPGHPEGSVASGQLFADELVLVVHPEDPLAKRASIEAEDLADYAYLTYNLAPSPGFEYDRFIRPAQAYPRTVTVIEQTSAITELVAAGAGVSILSRWALGPAIDSGRVAPVRCGTGLDILWNAVTRAGDPEGSPARLISNMLADHLAAE